MPSATRRTFSLPNEQSAFIDRKVNSGTYGSASEVVRAGLRALQERDEVVERWLVEEVAPTYDEVHADRSQLIPAEEVFAEIRSLHAARAGNRK